MRIAAAVLGILGGLGGILGARSALEGPIFVLGVSGHSTVTTEIALVAFFSFTFCGVGFAGAGFAPAKPRIAVLFFLVAAAGITISLSVFAIFATPLFLLASLFAFLGGGRTKKGVPDNVGVAPLDSL